VSFGLIRGRCWWDDSAAAVIHETPGGKAVVHSLRKAYTMLRQELAGAAPDEAQKRSRQSAPVKTYTKTTETRLLALVDDLGTKLSA